MFNNRPLFYSIITAVFVLSVIGVWNVGILFDYIDWVADHTNTYMFVLYFGGLILTVLLVPVAIGMVTEYPMWESKIYIANGLSSCMLAARNSWTALVAYSLTGAVWLTFTITGIVAVLF